MPVGSTVLGKWTQVINWIQIMNSSNKLEKWIQPDIDLIYAFIFMVFPSKNLKLFKQIIINTKKIHKLLQMFWLCKYKRVSNG